ncbi:alpha-1B-glycoprotein isoform X1 [Poecilia formosa]|uniref:alpha-1B-glycoprotein isoform X1 n=1 Tax=Poecilia formosa TaxID=48698 RepID=UPI0007BADA3C|nr:PREDICTED: alpha-1B-glycoprotein isoform X1 [Poecilia formosa]
MSLSYHLHSLSVSQVSERHFPEELISTSTMFLLKSTTSLGSQSGKPFNYADMLRTMATHSNRSERVSASTSSPTLPTPTLDIYSRSGDSVVLVCQAPRGHSGIVFMLYRDTKKMDSRELLHPVEQVRFTVRTDEPDSGQQHLYCCLYKNQEGLYSLFSPYLQLKEQRADAPTPPISSCPSPVLSVQPSDGAVTLGDTLHFRCSVPTHSNQLQSQSSKPAMFLLLREQTGITSVIPLHQASQVSNPEPQPGVFNVGPVRGGEEGQYTCLYQINSKKGLVNSSVSNVVQVTIRGVLPVPSLVLQQQTDVWHLLCTGSPAYPGSLFSLYVADSELPVATYRAKALQHQVTFPVPVQDSPVTFYECQYRALLGSTWSLSERSVPLALTTGNSPPTSKGVDWPLVLGSFSAAVLFLCSAVFVAVLVKRKVKAAAKEKKRRQQAQFWTKVHTRDHIVDLTLRRTSFDSQEWACGETETPFRSSLWSPLSTFTTPMH